MICMTEISDIERQLGNAEPGSNIVERLDQISMFLEPTYIKGQEDYDNPRKLLVSKELSVGNIKPEDRGGHMRSVRAAQEFLDNGQIGLARFIMKTLQSEFKISMSIEGKFMENITKQELRYTHAQHLYTHQEQQKRRGVLRRKRNVEPPSEYYRG